MSQVESKRGDSTGGGDSAADQRDQPDARRPYVAPRLATLGSVRELTFGTSLGTVENFGTRKAAGT